MSVFSNSRGTTSERYDAYVERLHELFHRHGVSYGKATDFMQLAPKLMRRGEFRIDFSMMLQWIQEQEAGKLTVDQMLMILGAATAGQKFPDVRTGHFAPLMVFLSGLGGWSETKGSNGARVPDSVQAEIAAAREVLSEERKPVEQAPLNASTRDGPVSGSASPSAPPVSANGSVRDGTSQAEHVATLRVEQNAATREPGSSPERVNRIRQQLEELDARAKSPKEAEAPRYRLIEPGEKPSPPPWQPTPVKAETAAPQQEPDIFRAYRQNLAEAEAKRKLNLKEIVMAVLAKLSGISIQEERKLRLLVGVFVFLVLLPPAMVCMLLYRDSLRIAASKEPSLTRVQGDELQAIDANVSRRAKGRARAGGQSRAEIAAIEKVPAKSGVSNPVAPPMTAEVGPDFLPETQVNRVGAENWMSVLSPQGQIGATPRAIPVFEIGPAKIHPAKPDIFPAIAETQFPMSGDMPRAIVEMMYPVVIAPADSAANFERRAPAISLASANAKMPSTGGTLTAGGLTPVKSSSPKQFDLLRPTVAVSAGLLSSEIVKFQMPDYPKAARKQRVEGDVLVRVVISKKGKIDKAVALNGPPTLRNAVEKAVRRWRYKPYMQNGQPVDVQTWVTFHFAMKEG